MVDSSARQKRYLVDLGYTLVGFLSFESSKMGIEDKESVPKNDLSLYLFTSSEGLPLESLVSHTYAAGCRK